MLATPTVFANTCNFKSIDGQEFEFGHISEYDQFLNKQAQRPSDSYPYFFAKDMVTNLTVDSYYGRNYKVLDAPFSIVLAPDINDPINSHNVRFYEAIADNCKPFFVRIDEHDSRFSKYFQMSDHKMDGQFPFALEQNALDSIHLKSLSQVESHVGKDLYVLNHFENEPYIAKDHYYQENLTELVPLSPYKLVEVDYNPFDNKGDNVSEFSMTLEDNEGNKFKAPYIKERLAFKDPLDTKRVRAKYHSLIKEGKIAYGMNVAEITVSWGVPQSVHYEGIYRNPMTNAEFSVSDYWPYGGDKEDFPERYTDYSGKIQKWYYPGKLLENEFLKIDADGIMRKYMQHERIHENVIQPRKFAEVL